MGYYINQELGYYEGDQLAPQDFSVPQRPDSMAMWDGQTWVIDTAKQHTVLAETIKAQIIDLEANQHRHLRDIALGNGNVPGGNSAKTPLQRLADLEAQIAALRSTLV